MIITLYGDNLFEIDRTLFKLKQNFINKYGALSIENINEENFNKDELLTSLNNIGIFSSKKLIIFKDINSSKELLELIEDIVKIQDDNNEIIIVAGTLDKRLSIYKSLKNKTDFREFSAKNRFELINWIDKYAKDNGGDISRVDSEYLVDRVGENQLLLSNEIIKLINFEPRISKENIEKLCDKNPDASVFDLIDAIFRNNIIIAENLYKDLRYQKEDPPKIIGMIVWQLLNLAYVLTAKNKTSSEIAKDAKANPYSINKSLALSKSLSLTKLKKIIDNLITIERQIKTTNINADEALLNFMIKVACE